MSAVTECVSVVEGHVGTLDHNERKLAELLCAQGKELADIVAMIGLLRWLLFKRQIESMLGRELSPEEEERAREMHRAGSTAEEICNALDPVYSAGTTRTPKP